VHEELRRVPGLTAASTRGSRTTWLTPSSRQVQNQTMVTGPKTEPTPRVPRCWNQNSPNRMTMVMGTTNRSSDGADDLQTLGGAEHRDRRREHAVAVEQRCAEEPDEHQARRKRLGCALGVPGTASAVSARMPPSPP
jgi:hypothetical protein